MKNKGRKHLGGDSQCKGWFGGSRPVGKMGTLDSSYKHGKIGNKALKKHWIKRMRGYLKSQTKTIFFNYD